MTDKTSGDLDFLKRAAPGSRPPEPPKPPAPEPRDHSQARRRQTLGEVFAALSGGAGEGPFAGCCTSFDEWQDAMAFKARQAAQERKRLGLPPEVSDPNDPMRRA